MAQLDSVSASDAEGCGGARRRRRRTSAEQSPSERQRPFARSIPAVYYNLIFYALVAQLDSVSASDAEGCGFDPRRVHHKKSPIAGFFYGLSCPTRPPPAAPRALKSVDKRQIAAYNLVRLRDGAKSKRPKTAPAPLEIYAEHPHQSKTPRRFRPLRDGKDLESFIQTRAARHAGAAHPGPLQRGRQPLRRQIFGLRPHRPLHHLPRAASDDRARRGNGRRHQHRDGGKARHGP